MTCSSISVNTPHSTGTSRFDPSLNLEISCKFGNGMSSFDALLLSLRLPKLCSPQQGSPPLCDTFSNSRRTLLVRRNAQF